ncbi:MAG: M23 family metallopeptidase [Pedobacter sp.]|nr:MAG: M23 family metallopeptidase [Pedobacter sp.]
MKTLYRFFLLNFSFFFAFMLSCAAQFSLPLQNFRLTSNYGMRLHPTLKVERFHSGIDLSASYEPVYSILPGVVTDVGSDKIIGTYVKVSHEHLQSIYGHLSAVVVEKGTPISAGGMLGISGNSGRTSGPHLHLSIKKSEKFLNPRVVIKALLAITINNMDQNHIHQTDQLSLAVMLILLAEQGNISLSKAQSEAYGVNVADQLPIEEEGGEDDY